MGPRGHRFLAHTADIRIEAWAPTRESCLAEAVTALTVSFADLSGGVPELDHTAEFAENSDVDLLVSVLDEVIYLLDTRSAVPVAAEFRPGPAASVVESAAGPEVESTAGSTAEVGPRREAVIARFRLAPLDRVSLTGPVPKAVTLHEIAFGPSGDRWCCAVTIDV